MAADGLTTNGQRAWVNTDKIVEKRVGDERVLIGCSGDTFMQDYVRHAYEIAHPLSTLTDSWAYRIACDLTDVARERESWKDGSMQAEFLLAWRDRLWELDTWQATPIDTFTAIGSGSPFALAAMHALANHNHEMRAVRAVDIACRLSPHSRGPVQVALTDPAEPQPAPPVEEPF